MENRVGMTGQPLAGVAEVVAQMQEQLPAHQAAWVQQLNQNPGGFADLERTIHHDFQKMAHQVVARLRAEVTEPGQDAKQMQ